MIYTDGLHLVADTEAELHEFAMRIGLKREWYQRHKRHPHYDLTTDSARRRAIKNGAEIVRRSDVLRKAREMEREICY